MSKPDGLIEVPPGMSAGRGAPPSFLVAGIVSPLTDVTVHGAQAPPADTWAKVTGTWHPGGTPGTTSASLALDASSVERIPAPASPYADRAPGP
ncbi:hypothetical protein ACH4SP_34245 [Streptomyces sp. NPDC021093]|uniref:hypothetical protein n=1 Tax=Streptomyces sp. NPDC021093 TaxID=3365112 RepID=UPI0037927A40